MSIDTWEAVDRYITELYLPPDPALDAALEESLAEGLPPINVSPPQGKLLYLLARLIQARSILEVGTLGGYSTIWLARALPSEGRLVTLERDPHHADVARTNIARAGLSEAVELRVGPALDTLPQLAQEGRGPFDLVFIDADKGGYPDYLQWSLKLTRQGSLIVADNVVRDGAVLDESTMDPDVKGVRRFHEMLVAEQGLDASVVQTVGSKGYDGFTLAVVSADASVQPPSL